jgi:hypothetical protein
MEAQAKAMEKEGIAEANVMTAKAQATENQGLAEAKVLEEKLSAQARGNEEVGLVEARVSKEKASAEAAGLIEKFAAMNNISVEAREFEEFKMNLEVYLKEAMANIDANKLVAKEQAKVIASALENSNIDIVGGQGDYFDKLAKGLGAGNALSGFMEKSPVLQSLLEKFLNASGEKTIADKSDS